MPTYDQFAQAFGEFMATRVPTTGNPSLDSFGRSAVRAASSEGARRLGDIFGGGSNPNSGYRPIMEGNPRPSTIRRTTHQSGARMNVGSQTTRQRRWKTGLPSEWQKVEKPVKGSNKRGTGTLTTYKSKSKKVRRLNDKFDQTYRITQFLCNPNVCYDSVNNVIKNRDSVILQGSLNKHYKMLLFNATPCLKPDVYNVGNNLVPFDQPGWIFSTTSDNQSLRKGYTDEQSGATVNIGTNTGATSDTRTLCTISGIPYSASSAKYETPNHVFKGVNLNFEIELLNLNQNAEFFCKMVRYKKPLKENFDFSDKGTFGDAQREAYNEITKHLLNNEKTDRENFDTIFLYTKKVSAPKTGGPLRKIKIDKKIKTNYLRTSTYLHTDLVDNPTLGSGQRPDFKTHEDAIYNNCMVVLGMRYLDDNQISIGMNNVAASNDITDMELRPALEIAPTDANACRFKVRGYLTSFFGARDLERNNQSHASTIVDLHQRVTALESHVDNVDEHQHPDLSGTWNHSNGNVVLTVTASSTAGIDYDVAYQDTSTGFTNSLTWIDDGNHIVMKNTSTGTHSSWSLSNNGTVITAPSGDQYTKQ